MSKPTQFVPKPTQFTRLNSMTTNLISRVVGILYKPPQLTVIICPQQLRMPAVHVVQSFMCTYCCCGTSTSVVSRDTSTSHPFLSLVPYTLEVEHLSSPLHKVCNQQKQVWESRLDDFLYTYAHVHELEHIAYACIICLLMDRHMTLTQENLPTHQGQSHEQIQTAIKSKRASNRHQ